MSKPLSSEQTSKTTLPEPVPNAKEPYSGRENFSHGEKYVPLTYRQISERYNDGYYSLD